MIETRRSRGVRLLLTVCIAMAGCLAPGCKREKPNATRDIRKNQDQYMDEMDRISKKLAEEERTKTKAPPEKEPPAASTPDPAKSPKEPVKPGDPG